MCEEGSLKEECKFSKFLEKSFKMRHNENDSSVGNVNITNVNRHDFLSDESEDKNNEDIENEQMHDMVQEVK